MREIDHDKLVRRSRGRGGRRTAAVGAAVALGLSGLVAAVAPASGATDGAQRAAAAAAEPDGPHLSVSALEVNHLEAPLGIDDSEPVLRWRMESNVIGAK